MVKLHPMPDVPSLTLLLLSGALAAFMRLACWKAGLVEGGRSPWKFGSAASFAGGAVVGFFVLSGLETTGQALVWAFYAAVLVALSIIDLEEKVIPKKIWMLVLLFSLPAAFLMPSIMGKNGALEGLGAAVAGSLAGGGIIFLMVEVGKLMFGKVELSWDTPKSYSIEMGEGGWLLSSEGEKMPLADMFMRKSDTICIENADGQKIVIWESAMDCGRGREAIGSLSGLGKKITLPREAMGFGDVKFMLMAGAMTGWEGAVFAIFAGSLIGALVGGAGKLLKGHTEIPFIPFLASGIVLFMVFPAQVKEMMGIVFGGGF